MGVWAEPLTREFWLDLMGDWYVAEPMTGCWLWVRATNSEGYGLLKRGRTLRAHQVSYTLLRGPIPEGLQIDHLCKTPCCVNPDHMEPVTSRENTLRGSSPLAQKARQTHCKYGHPLSGDNLYVEPKRPRSRRCLTCMRAHGIASHYKRKGTRVRSKRRPD